MSKRTLIAVLVASFDKLRSRVCHFYVLEPFGGSDFFPATKCIPYRAMSARPRSPSARYEKACGILIYCSNYRSSLSTATSPLAG